jgi:hypothetical protein
MSLATHLRLTFGPRVINTWDTPDGDGIILRSSLLFLRHNNIMFRLFNPYCLVIVECLPRGGV